MLALSAFLAPNLEFLGTRPRTCSYDSHSESILLEHISRSALGKPVSRVHSFNKLRSLHVEAYGAFYIPNRHVFPFVLLPKLGHLTLGGWGAIEEAGELYNIVDPNNSDVFETPWK